MTETNDLRRGVTIEVARLTELIGRIMGDEKMPGVTARTLIETRDNLSALLDTTKTHPDDESAPVPCDDCETTGQNCRAHRTPPPKTAADGEPDIIVSNRGVLTLPESLARGKRIQVGNGGLLTIIPAPDR